MHRTSNIQSRFTVYGSRLLDERIKRDLKYIVQFLVEQQESQTLRSIWLGGSYGRGEGAVYREQDQERPWFDYDIYLIYDSLESAAAELPRYRAWETALSAHLTLPVQLRTLDEPLDSLGPHLRWYDLCLAHQVIWGNADLIPQLREGPLLPLDCALKLLMYWGGRLLQLSNGVLDHDPLASFYRCVEALGDACLIVLGRYHFLSQTKALRFHDWQRSQGYSWLRELGYLYQEALQYRLQPSEFSSMHTQLPVRIPALISLFTQVYLTIFEQDLQHLQAHETVELAHFAETFFAGTLYAQARSQLNPSQLRHLLANLRLYRGRNFDLGWYARPLIDRLYFLLPFLLNQQLPEAEILQQVLPDLPANLGLSAVNEQFFSLWDQIQAELI